MKRIGIAALLCVWGCMLCQERTQHPKLRVDLSAPHTGLPHETSITMKPIPGHVFDGPPPPPDDLAVTYRSDTNVSSAENTITITNVSARTLSLPVSRDGAKAYEACLDRQVTTSIFFRLPSDRDPSRATVFGELYGCDSFKGSMVSLRPGESIEMFGVATLTPLNYGALPATFYSVLDDKFSDTEGALHSYIDSKFYVPVKPEDPTPVCGKR